MCCGAKRGPATRGDRGLRARVNRRLPCPTGMIPPPTGTSAGSTAPASCGNFCGEIPDMSHGMPEHRRSLVIGAACLARSNGGSTFAEHPLVAAPHARLLWVAELDPSTLSVTAVPGERSDPDHIDPDLLAPWLTLATDLSGGEHAVLSDGLHRIRLDVEAGSLVGHCPVVLHYRLHGTVSAEPKLLPLRRLIDLCRHRRFAGHLFPADPRVERWILALRVFDALRSGASQREIAITLYGADRVGRGWPGDADSLRSRVRRLVRDARALATGGYRTLMRKAR